jgi:single-strand DNA-binding protein
MSASLNEVRLIGNLGGDPEVKTLNGDKTVATFRIATNETWKDSSGQKQERTEWHQVEVFGKAAQVARDYLAKGRQVYLEGSIRYDEWTDKDGNKKYMTKIRVSGPGSRMVLLGSRGDGPAAGRSGGPEAVREPAGAGGPPADDFQVSDDDVPF